MITCPICGTYWDYQKEIDIDLTKYAKAPRALFIQTEEIKEQLQRYRLKEQGDCINHVAHNHSTIVLTEILTNEIDKLRTLIKNDDMS